MRVLVAHNRYSSSSPSGENDVVDDEIGLLTAAGCQVETYLRSSDEIDDFGPVAKLALAGRPVYSRESTRAFGRLLDSFRPDVVHLHNPFPLISPAVVRVAARRGVPVVQTVHNYRHGCVAGTLFRDGRVCEDCLGRPLPWPAVAHGCYRGSRAQSVPMVTAQVAHRPTWQRVSRFLALTGFMAEQLVRTGIPADRVTVRPTAVADPGPPTGPGSGFLFVGRLTSEKGLRLLISAWRASGLDGEEELVIAGDGPLLDECRAAAQQLASLRVLGRVEAGAVHDLMRSSAVVITPSLWYEGFPRVVVEAFSHGRPVIATTVGSLGEIVDVDVGWSVPPGAPQLAQALREARGPSAAERGRAARSRFEARFRHDTLLRQLLDVYAEVSA